MDRNDTFRISTSMLLAAAAVLQARQDTDPATQRNAVLARACLHNCGAAGSRLLLAVDHLPGRLLLAALERLYLPGLSAHYAWRKHRIREWALRSCAAGIRQVLIFGAGFDGLPLTLLARSPALRVFEIEREGNVAIKRAALQSLELHEPRWSLIAEDLRAGSIEPLLRALPAFEPQAPTLIVAEGVLMYMELAEVKGLLQNLAQVLPGAELIATAMDRPGFGPPGFARQRPWVNRWLKRADEPFRWGVTRIALPALLAEVDVRLNRLADPQANEDPDPSPGEWLFAGSLLYQSPNTELPEKPHGDSWSDADHAPIADLIRSAQ